MITKEQYLEAKKIVDEYREQLRIANVVESEKCEWKYNHGMMRKKGYASCKKCGLIL